MKYEIQGVCPTHLSYNIIDGKVHDVKFYGGCDGNLKAFAKLIEGLPKEKVIELLAGNTCGSRPTSCADQLAQLLKSNF